jgi:diguanylate cyclase (GGDEF)-like protein
VATALELHETKANLRMAGDPAEVDGLCLAAPWALLSGHDVAMGWILTAMIAFGGVVGLAFPFLVTPMIDLKEGQHLPFTLACVAAGFCVGGFAYGVSKFTLYRANRRLTVLAAYDPLTRLVNRREFVRSLSSELVRAERDGERLSVVIADLDHFKAVNDQHGHLTGDDVLVGVACDLVRSVRPFDLVARIGGEEFAVVLPRTTKHEAILVAQRIRTLIALSGHDELPGVTVSCGVATYPEDAESLRLLTKRADDAMYAAKRAGRNRVRTWSADLNGLTAED